MPTSEPASISSVVGVSAPAIARIIHAATTPENAIRLPTDRSIPAVMMTSVIPMAMMATTEICFMMFSRLECFRKFGQR